MAARKKRANHSKSKTAENYRHPESDSPMPPEVGTQVRFTKKLPPKTCRYVSSLSPAMDWDGQNPARELGEWLIRQIQEAVALPAPHAFAENANSGPAAATRGATCN